MYDAELQAVYRSADGYRERARGYYKKNPKPYNERSRAYYQKNREKILAKKKEQYRAKKGAECSLTVFLE